MVVILTPSWLHSTTASFSAIGITTTGVFLLFKQDQDRLLVDIRKSSTRHLVQNHIRLGRSLETASWRPACTLRGERYELRTDGVLNMVVSLRVRIPSQRIQRSQMLSRTSRSLIYGACSVYIASMCLNNGHLLYRDKNFTSSLSGA